MAADIPRTASDDAADALRKLDDAALEITRWQAHLKRIRDGAELPVAMQARRVAWIVDALVGEAAEYTLDAVCHAAGPADALLA
jgi:hypothetical protein